MLTELNEEQKAEVTKILLRINRRKFTPEIILHIIGTVNKLRVGTLKLTDWFVPDVMNYEDWSYQFYLNKFVGL